MQKGNAIFYHGHILSNIDKLDVRKDRYMGNRLGFLNKVCVPIQHEIDSIKHKIKYYEDLKDQKYQIIENQPDILALKQEISEYMNTNAYYNQKIDQLDLSIVLLHQKISEFKAIKDARRQKYKLINLTPSFSSQLENSIVSGKKKTTLNQLSTFRSPAKIKYSSESIELQQSESKFKLPKISKKLSHKPEKYFYFHRQVRARSPAQVNSSITTVNLSSLEHTLSKSSLQNQEQTVTQSYSQSQIRDLISQFDRCQSLFRDCFERKKIMVQKCVSQLQSKLISNKAVFLKVCRCIGQKNSEISYEDFQQLTVNELITLLISFSWLSRRIYNQFSAKRKNILAAFRNRKQIFH